MGRLAPLLFQCLVATSSLVVPRGADGRDDPHLLPLLHPHEEGSVGVQYRGAATQYAPQSAWGEGGAQGVLDSNFLTMLQLAQQASEQGADIIVFPEYGLTSTNLGTNRSQFRELCQVVPDPEDVRTPCLEEISHDNYRVVQSLSCLAMELDMYVVVDLAELSIENHIQTRFEHANMASASSNSMKDSPKGGQPKPEAKDEMFVAFNTQVVFDRTGAVVARYRKKHLFLESAFAYGNESDYTALFTADFGVTFSLQVCFDIMYGSPALTNVVSVGVRDVVMSTAWVDELPFLTAPQIFSSWSKGLQVNLVVSNLYMPVGGELGSGIFHGSHHRNPTYTYDVDVSDPVVMVDDISTTVSGDMMMDFNESQDIVIKKRVKGLMKLLNFVDVVGDDSEEDGPFLGEGITNENVGQAVEEFIQRMKLHWRGKKMVDRVLRTLLKDQRRVAEWDRFRNRLTCSKICQRVRYLLQQSQQMASDISEKNEDSQKYLQSYHVQNLTNSEAKYFENGTLGPNFASKTNHFIIHENISFYSNQSLAMNDIHFPNRTQRAKCCHLDTFCCEVDYTYPQEESFSDGSKYTLLAYNGTVAKGSGVYEMWTQVCAVVFCTGRGIDNCTPLDAPQPDIYSSFRLQSIRGQFDTRFLYPSVFSLNFSLVDNGLWSYAGESNDTDGNSVLSLDGDVPNLLTAALFGRWYSLDP